MSKVRFGHYTFDPATGELSGPARSVRLPNKAAEVLELLLSRPGELVTRAALQAHLWPSDTFVDFDNNLNAAVRKLRAALADSADSPRFIETLPKRGYRFLPEVAVLTAVGPRCDVTVERPAAAGDRGTESKPQEHVPRHIGSAVPDTLSSTRFSRPRWAAFGGALLVAAAVMLSGDRRDPAFASVIVVAPFINLSGDSAQNHISDGLTAELTTQLAMRPNYRVVAHKAGELSTPVADFVVEGSSRQDGNGLFVTARVVRGERRDYVWAGAFRCPQGDSAAIQRQLAVKIAAAFSQKGTVFDAFASM